jgi:hypothetical protein
MVTSGEWKRRNPLTAMLYLAKTRARLSDLVFELVAADLHAPTHCPILGIKLVYGGGRGRREDNSASLDRHVPHLGYVRGNVSIISWRANAIKSNAESHELHLVAAYASRCEEEGGFDG